MLDPVTAPVLVALALPEPASVPLGRRRCGLGCSGDCARCICDAEEEDPRMGRSGARMVVVDAEPLTALAGGANDLGAAEDVLDAAARSGLLDALVVTCELLDALFKAEVSLASFSKTVEQLSGFSSVARSELVVAGARHFRRGPRKARSTLSARLDSSSGVCVREELGVPR